MKTLRWTGTPRVCLWDGRYIVKGETVNVDEERAKVLVARDDRWLVVKKERPHTRKGDD